MSQQFGPAVRLRSRNEFEVVQHQGQRVATRYLVLLGRPNALERDRLGIIASRKFGGAVMRNRAKRRLREIFRHLEPARAAALGLRAMDLVAIPRRDLLTAPYATVQVAFASAVRRLRAGGVSP